MKCIVAQGNPGLQYHTTRHNIGFWCLDAYIDKIDTQFTEKSKFFAYVAEAVINSEKVLFVKPTTFYNETGKSVRSIKDFYKLSNDDILVLHDDLALDFGKIRIRHRGSDAGNNGIKSITATIGESYARVRFGIYNERRDVMNDADFVLAKFSSGEQEVIKKTLLPLCFESIEKFIGNTLVDESYSLA